MDGIKDDLTDLVTAFSEGAPSPTGSLHSVLSEKAMELVADVVDYETPARLAGWKDSGGRHGAEFYFQKKLPPDMPQGPFDYEGRWGTWQSLCEEYGLVPVTRTPSMFWAVTPQLAATLGTDGETILDYESVASANGWSIAEMPGPAVEVEFYAWSGGDSTNPTIATTPRPSRFEAWMDACHIGNLDPLEVVLPARIVSGFGGLTVWASFDHGTERGLDLDYEPRAEPVRFSPRP